MTVRYVVVATAEDGSHEVFGPFSDARADLAALALMEVGFDVSTLMLRSSSDLTSEYPDWRRSQTRPEQRPC